MLSTRNVLRPNGIVSPERQLGTALVSVGGSPADNLTFEVPWVNLGVIFAALYRIALATTCRPAQSTVRVCPAEALRYQ
jgi:hypothetical protein